MRHTLVRGGAWHRTAVQGGGAKQLQTVCLRPVVMCVMAANSREAKLFAGIVIKDDDIEDLDEKKEIGRGCYGAVYDVRVYGVRCIAKRQHDILVGRGKEERLDPEQRAAAINCFRKECILLCSFRHPNVVQVMGVHCGSDEATRFT